MNTKYFSKQLANDLELMLGSEDIVNIRRMKYVKSNTTTDMCQVLHSGSTSEGFDLPNQDLDIMLVASQLVLYSIDDKDPELDSELTYLQLVYDPKFQGSVLLKVWNHNHLMDRHKLWFQVNKKWTTFHNNMFVLNASEVRETYRNEFVKHFINMYVTGPCVRHETKDFALGLELPFWPKCANEWNLRHRQFEWPSNTLIGFIVAKVRCCVMPITEVNCDIEHLLWRISFSRAETVLVSSFSYQQFQIYGLMKIFLKQILHKELDDEGEPYVSSYHVKNIMFHMIENSPATLWSQENLFQCFWCCLHRLTDCIEKTYLSHYFMHGLNLLLKRENGENKMKTVSFLKKYLNKPISEVLLDLKRLVGSEDEDISLEMNLNKEFINDRIQIFGASSFCNIICCNDKLFGSIFSRFTFGNSPPPSLNDLLVIGTIIMKSSLEDIKTSKVTNTPNKLKYRLLHKAKRGLIHCSGLDSTKGWLTLAYYFYEISNFQMSLEMCKIATENFNQPWVADPLDNESMKVKQQELYFKEFIGKNIGIFEKIKKVKVLPVNLCEISTDDFEPEVEFALLHFNMIIIHPMIYASLLKVLCHNKLYDANARLESFNDLQKYMEQAIDNFQSIPLSVATVRSCAGVCCEIIGDYSQAAAYFEEAFQEYKRHKNQHGYRDEGAKYVPAIDRLEKIKRDRHVHTRKDEFPQSIPLD